MIRFLTVVLLLASFTRQAYAAEAGIADMEGTIHAGIKIGSSNINNSSGAGFLAGYTLFGPNTFTNSELLSRMSIAIEGEYVDLTGFSSARTLRNVSTFGFVGAASYPISKSYSVIAKLGLASSTRKNSCGQVWCDSTTTYGLHGAAAWQYNVGKRMAFLAGYDYYNGGYSMISFNVVTKY